MVVSEGGGPASRRRRFWLTVGEVVAVLALGVAALNYWDAHKQHAEAVRQASAEARGRAAFVVTGAADAEGRRIVLTALKPSQAIQSQRYLFPREILDHPMEVTAARPRIDLDWIGEGLRRALSSAHVKGAGEGLLPVAIVTTYVEDGETRRDTSLYQIGYAWRPRLLRPAQLRLQGIALARRDLPGDPRPPVEARWKARGPAVSR